MCKIRTALTLPLCGLLSLACTSETGECAAVSGYYYPQFEVLQTQQLDGEPSDCSDFRLGRINLSSDNVVRNTTSVEDIDVWNGGCDFTVDYTRSLTTPNNLSQETLSMNAGSVYRVEDDGVLRGEAVYVRRDVTGTPSCAALLDATWMPEDMWLSMQGTNP